MPVRTILKMCVWMVVTLHLLCFSLHAQEKDADRVYELGTVQVLEEGTEKKVIFQPKSDTFLVDEYVQPVIPQNIVDVIKDTPIIDFRGASDLVPDDDTIFMRGFSSKRFVTSIDGLTVRKSGGRRSSHIVDYSLIPAWMIEEVEVLPGPHSALYPSKAIGGVLNLKTRTPRRYETSKPEGKAQASYRTYNTQNHNANIHGGHKGLIYDLGGQTYSTDGFLRNNEADINTVHGRGGYVFDQGGYVTLSGTYTDADRQVPTINDPNDSQSGHDSDYPIIDSDVSGYYERCQRVLRVSGPHLGQDSLFFDYELQVSNSIRRCQPGRFLQLRRQGSGLFQAGRQRSVLGDTVVAVVGQAHG